jgi:tRNA-binding protein
MAIRKETDIDTFLDLDIRAGVVERAEAFPDAKKPSIKVWIDFGDEVGTKTSSAQLTRRYSPDDLVGTTVLGVVNFPPRRIAGFVSEVLVLGVVDPEDGGDVVLVRPDGDGDVRGWRLA